VDICLLKIFIINFPASTSKLSKFYTSIYLLARKKYTKYYYPPSVLQQLPFSHNSCIHSARNLFFILKPEFKTWVIYIHPPEYTMGKKYTLSFYIFQSCMQLKIFIFFNSNTYKNIFFLAQALPNTFPERTTMVNLTKTKRRTL
jgi:hypothetical protein